MNSSWLCQGRVDGEVAQHDSSGAHHVMESTWTVEPDKFKFMPWLCCSLALWPWGTDSAFLSLFSHLLKRDKISTAKKIDVKTQRIDVHKRCIDRKGVKFGRTYWSGTRLVGKQPTEMHAHMYEETCTRMFTTAPCVLTPNNLNVHRQCVLHSHIE